MGDLCHVTFPAVSSGQSVPLLPLFAISTAEDGDAYVIQVEGELDLVLPFRGRIRISGGI
jgi:hypothetical protein